MSISLVPAAQDLRGLNTFGLASRADAFVTLEDEAQLPALSALAVDYPACFVLGGGSNLVLGESVAGLVVRVALRGIRLVEARPDVWIVEAAAGERWHEVVAHCVEQGWDGLENLALIPGTVGAAPVQNIGAYGVELSDRFDSLSAWDLREARATHFSAADCRYAYRDSVFKREPGRWLITRVRFALPRPWRAVLEYPDLQRWPALQQGPADARAIFQAVCGIRRAKLPDPAVIGNAGSFFKNPLVDAATHEHLQARFPGLVSYPQPDGRYKLAAGWLIDQCGWKGRSLGPAGVHDRQALVLVNRGGAAAADILALAAAIQEDVMARYGVWLEPEPIVVR
ncbi:UDP-N-acetylenolpyruvoylglucosamine reductase [Bordetella hinzii]|uniref:UDP-N-acetylmuramate dehydrogenase n=2 Tax=Bordetella hinzii TaxID=103855 RepID=UPI0004953041|nr:UDP-N-acetylmuramate dehydrogenase [Bordetella hinzii]AKQ54351.1 UDP-N-acetylenolpyruvoylglucosamine reductase [Bordetella hinzii]SNV96654.1 UDP-N-acetylenolpyruvoylglucosamine reductase [Bordetella hinzii]